MNSSLRSFKKNDYDILCLRSTLTFAAAFGRKELLFSFQNYFLILLFLSRNNRYP